MNKFEFDPDYAVPPGETLLELMKSSDMSTPEFMEKSGLSLNTLFEIITGEQSITDEIADMLESGTNVPAKMWTILESNYRDQVAKIEGDK